MSQNKNLADLRITKASGEKSLYDRMKLIQSMVRSGASIQTAEMVASEVEEELEEGTSTKKIYRKAFRLLRQKSVHVASQYHLKQAVMQLGPSGYPFEQFVGELFKADGYDVRVGQILRGSCVNHEVDVIAYKENYVIVCECKFRNQPGSKTDVKVALYVHSRFNDLRSIIEAENGEFLKLMELGPYNKKNPVSTAYNSDRPVFFQGAIVTNAKFTEDAVQYGECADLLLIGWDHDGENSLLQMIRRSGRLPVTLLKSISGNEIQRVISRGIVVCRDLLEKIDIVDELGIDKTKKRRLTTELEHIVNI